MVAVGRGKTLPEKYYRRDVNEQFSTPKNRFERFPPMESRFRPSPCPPPHPPHTHALIMHLETFKRIWMRYGRG